jgi:HEAT repeat protein
VSDGQLDLFSEFGIPPVRPAPADARSPGPPPADLDDAALLAAIPASGLADGPPLAAEAGRRRLGAAIPVLEDYCRRFAGFGVQRALPEQVAALDALAAIGGQEAARSVARIIGRGWVQGPTLATAVADAARLGSQLPADIVAALLRHADRSIRRNACRLARQGPEVTAILVDLLGDLSRDVGMEAACALGHMGRPEAVPLLKHALRQGPSVRVIEAVAPVADEECVVLLGRLARDAPDDFAAAARDALEAVEHPLAARLLERIRQG